MVGKRTHIRTGVRGRRCIRVRSNVRFHFAVKVTCTTYHNSAMSNRGAADLATSDDKTATTGRPSLLRKGFIAFLIIAAAGAVVYMWRWHRSAQQDEAIHRGAAMRELRSLTPGEVRRMVHSEVQQMEREHEQRQKAEREHARMEAQQDDDGENEPDHHDAGDDEAEEEKTNSATRVREHERDAHDEEGAQANHTDEPADESLSQEATEQSRSSMADLYATSAPAERGKPRSKRTPKRVAVAKTSRRGRKSKKSASPHVTFEAAAPEGSQLAEEEEGGEAPLPVQDIPSESSTAISESEAASPL